MPITLFSLPQRRAHIQQLRQAGVFDYEYQLLFQGRLQQFTVYTVEIGLPSYRLKNGRTRAVQLERISTSNLPADFFSADPDSEPALRIQDEILREMVNEAGLLKFFRKNRQDQPLILDNDGYVINGNRRLCAMRLLLEQNETAYEHFKHVQVILLPPCSDRDIKELEGQLQVQPDIRSDYSWTAEAMLFRDNRNDNWTDDMTASLYKKKVSEVRELIAMLEDAENYLSTRGKNHIYSFVVHMEYAFRQLQKLRRKCGEESRKQLLTQISYLMIDDQDSPEGRLYESIPDAYKYLDQISDRIRAEIPSPTKVPVAVADDLNILGTVADTAFPELIQVLETPENAKEARLIIKDTIEELNAQDRIRRDATFCFKQIQQAHTRLQSALSSLDDGADTTGIEEVLKNIELALANIREWLSNANDQT